MGKFQFRSVGFKGVPHVTCQANNACKGGKIVAGRHPQNSNPTLTGVLVGHKGILSL